MIHWTDLLREGAQYVPFLSLVNKQADQPEQVWKHPLTVRLLEAAIIGAVVMYGTVQGAQQQIEQIGVDLQEMRLELKEVRAQLRLVEQEQWRRNGIDKLSGYKIAGGDDVP